MLSRGAKLALLLGGAAAVAGMAYYATKPPADWLSLPAQRFVGLITRQFVAASLMTSGLSPRGLVQNTINVLTQQYGRAPTSQEIISSLVAQGYEPVP